MPKFKRKFHVLFILMTILTSQIVNSDIELEEQGLILIGQIEVILDLVQMRILTVK